MSWKQIKIFVVIAKTFIDFTHPLWIPQILLGYCWNWVIFVLFGCSGDSLRSLERWFVYWWRACNVVHAANIVHLVMFVNCYVV